MPTCLCKHTCAHTNDTWVIYTLKQFCWLYWRYSSAAEQNVKYSWGPMFEPQHHKKKKNLCALIQLRGFHTIFKFHNLNGVWKDAWMEAPYIYIFLINLFVCTHVCAPCAYMACKGQEKTSDFLDSQLDRLCRYWELNLRYSRNDLNCQAITSVPSCINFLQLPINLIILKWSL